MALAVLWGWADVHAYLSNQAMASIGKGKEEARENRDQAPGPFSRGTHTMPALREGKKEATESRHPGRLAVGCSSLQLIPILWDQAPISGT